MAPHCRASARRREDGRLRDDRHHDQGRSEGRLQRLSHGHHRRERRAPVADHPRRAGPLRASPRRTRPRPRRRPAASRTRSCRSRSRAARATSSSTQDEYIRHGATLEAMPKLRPAFDKEGTVTAANASGINDGAAAAVLMSEAEADAPRHRRRLRASSPGRPPASIPQIMGTGPIPASRKALEKAGWSVGDLDLVEANEAFAAQACAVNKDMGWDPDDRQRQWRRDRHRPSDRRLGRPRPQHAAATRCGAAAPRRASPRCASAAAWASPCASKRLNGD